jgi:beta-glucosidase
MPINSHEGFPADFLWGASTAAYQIEGAVAEDGRGPSIWDSFTKQPGKVLGGDSGDVACDHYHRYKEDIDLVADLGASAYRFSLAWPRLFPAGSAERNERGFDFYKRLIDYVRSKGLKTMVTLYHWDLPQSLEDAGGWLNRDTAFRYRDMAAACFAAFGESVDYWTTFNEPHISALLGYQLGFHAPGIVDKTGRNQFLAGHTLLLGHGLAVQAYRDSGLKAPIGIVLNMGPNHPLTPADAEVARFANETSCYWYADAVAKGAYPEAASAQLRRAGIFPSNVQDADMGLISSKIDYIGVNYYSSHLVKAASGPIGFEVVPTDKPKTEMEWDITPEAFHELFLGLAKRYPGMPLYVTENGAAFKDEVEGDRVHDPKRVDYLRRHFEAARSFIAAGVPLKGYMVWSLLDNFEWAMGYSKRFGIVYVDYATQRRIPKDSYYFMRDYIQGKA